MVTILRTVLAAALVFAAGAANAAFETLREGGMALRRQPTRNRALRKEPRGSPALRHRCRS